MQDYATRSEKARVTAAVRAETLLRFQAKERVSHDAAPHAVGGPLGSYRRDESKYNARR